MPKETIVILDPELNTQWPLKTFLENEDYNVVPVNTIEKARKKFSEFEVSGLITEYWSNHSSTLETVRGFKKSFPEAYVMLLTHGEIKEREYEEIIDAGADDFFAKMPNVALNYWPQQPIWAKILTFRLLHSHT